MPFLRTAFCLALLALAACSEPRRTTLAKAQHADLDKIRADVEQLHQQHFSSPGPEFVPLRPEWWPASTHALQPVRMTLYHDGLAITMVEEPGEEYGIHVVRAGDSSFPKTTPITQYQWLRDGTLFYVQKR
jgi:hypothetical protein